MTKFPTQITMTEPERRDLLRTMALMAREQGMPFDNPIIECEQLIRRVLKGITKEGKTWINAPKTLQARFRVCGWDYENKKWRRNKASPVRAANIDAALDPEEEADVQKRLKELLDTYDNFGSNPGDITVAEQMVRAQVTITRLQQDIQMAKSGREKEAYGKAIKIHSDVAKTCGEQLGITRSRRREKEGEEAHGTIDELVYMMDAWIKGPARDVAARWLLEELAMDLRKADRILPDGTPEMTPELFEYIHLISMDRARELVGDPYAPDIGRWETSNPLDEYELTIEAYEPMVA